MKVTYYDYEPGGGRSLRVRESMHNIEISKTGNGCGPYVFAQTVMMKDFGLPSMIICKAEDLYKIEEEE